MAMRATISVKGVDELKRKFKTLSEEIQQKITADGTKIGFKIQATAKQNAPVDTGRLRADIAVSVEGMRVSIFNTVNYAPFVHFGTAVGHFPPPDALATWASRHGMAGMEFVIARGISRRGLPPRPYLQQAFQTHKREYEEMVKNVLRGLR